MVTIGLGPELTPPPLRHRCPDCDAWCFIPCTAGAYYCAHCGISF